MKKYITITFIILSALILNGCANNSSHQQKVIKIQKENYFTKDGVKYKKTDIGTAVRWNNDYIVTVKHVNFTEGKEILTPYDIKFVKSSPDDVSIPLWRVPNGNENIKIVGFNLSGNMVEHNGKDIDVYREEDNGEINRFSTAITEGGQSGGLVLGSDGKALGILVGLAKIKDPDSHSEFKGKGNVFSIYIPYDFILLAWQESLKNSK